MIDFNFFNKNNGRYSNLNQTKMKTIKFISNTKEGWETDGEFNPLFLEVTEEEKEYCFDIGKRD